MNSIFENITNSVSENIKNGDFQTAEAGITQLNHIHEVFLPLIHFLTQYQSSSTEIMNNLQTISEQTSTLVKSLRELNEKMA
jgi:hypothetical protein